MIRRHFPEYEVEMFDVAEAIKRDRRMTALAFAHALRIYGLDILKRRRTLRTAFFRTPYVFDAMGALVRRHFAHGPYAFGFQIQSVFDGSLPGLPHFIYTDHTHLANLLYPDFDASKLYDSRWIERERQVYRGATRTFTWSAHVSRSLLEHYACPPERVACVYAGSNVPLVDRPLTNDGYRNKNILFVGINWQRKGGPDLVAAFEEVLRTHPDARLTIVGVAPETALPNVHVVGRVPLGEVPTFYREASVFCLPTRIEPFGIVFVEALAHRLPVIGTKIGAVPEMVLDGENGLLVEPGDPRGLARALVALLDSPETCRRLGERGYALARDRYTWERVGERVRAHVERALAPAVLSRA